MKLFRLLAIAGIQLVLFACDKTPAYTVASVSDYKILTGTVCTEVKVKINPATSKEEIERLLNKVLKDQYGRSTPIGHPEAFKIRAFYDTDSELKKPIASLFQALGGRIAFEYNNEVTYDRELEKPVLSPEEQKRQEEVGKFAVDLMKEAEKIRNRNNR